MSEFHETRMGQEFYLKNFPKLIKEMGRIADALERVAPAPNTNTILCQKIDEGVFERELEKVTNGDVTVGYDFKAVPSFTSQKMNKELSFNEISAHLKKIIKNQTEKDVENIENVSAKDGYVFIAFTVTK